ncbi:MAG: Isoquinoline 1-oxidoreductase subunit [Deltaproteobacteria bacterium]|nr:Isoquinoline 1-oxidoreductase subunit [Deltaproteobacteria bacterium]
MRRCAWTVAAGALALVLTACGKPAPPAGGADGGGSGGATATAAPSEPEADSREAGAGAEGADTGESAGSTATSEADATSASAHVTQPGGEPLKGVSDFADIADVKARSVALFEEAGKVLTHPRCLNCHPAGDSPTQGDKMTTHEPPLVRGEDGLGPVGMRCQTCHTAKNVELGDRSVPGDPAWKLAPLAMAWQGKDLRAICEQLKDPARNGGRDLEAIIHHVSEDHLVGWGWAPGTGRTPAPGTQEGFGKLIAAWVETGAACP